MWFRMPKKKKNVFNTPLFYKSKSILEPCKSRVQDEVRN